MLKLLLVAGLINNQVEGKHDALKDLKVYQSTNWTQRLVILFDQPNQRWVRLTDDDHYTNSPTQLNPNRLSPYNVNGGLEKVNSRDFKSIKMTNIGVIKNVKGGLLAPSVYRQGIPVVGTSTLIPGDRWVYPEGTVFADVLCNEKTGKVFEIRTRTKGGKGDWMVNIPFEDNKEWPIGYKGINGKSCNKCHQDAGNSQQYGITVRGGDTIFSFNPSQEHRIK